MAKQPQNTYNPKSKSSSLVFQSPSSHSDHTAGKVLLFYYDVKVQKQVRSFQKNQKDVKQIHNKKYQALKAN